MNTRLALPVLLLAVLLPMTAHAAKKNKEQKMPSVAPSAGSTGIPSGRLEPFLEPCLDAILSPLDGDPKMPRVEVEKLRASFSVGQIKATTQMQQQIYQNAMAVCDALTRSMDDRANAKAAAQASSTVPMRSNATGIIKSSPMRGVDAGANAEAIRKKQKDERKDADAVAQRNVAYMNSAAGRSWVERAPVLRRGVMALFTRQVQLEALEERNAAIAAQAAGAAQAAQAAQVAKAAQAEAATRIAAAETAAKAAKAAAAEKATMAVRAEAAARAAAADKAAKTAQAEATAKAEAAKKAETAKLAREKSLATEAAYVGEWALREGSKSMTVNEDHTAIKTLRSGEQTNGAWNIVDGMFRLHWEEGTGVKGQLSADGQAIEGGKGLQWLRKKASDESSADAPSAKPAPQPSETVTPPPAAKTANSEPANESPYVGMWKGAGNFEIKSDHTVTRTKGSGDKTDGTWTIDEDGDFFVTWADKGKFKAKLSKDGQTLNSTVGKGNASWTRSKP